MKDIEILEYQPAHRPYFEQLYRDWFTGHFGTALEPIDEFVLTQPEKAILEKDGAILVVVYEDKTAGFVALKKAGSYSYELTKMAVDEAYRGKGLGETLCRTAIDRARLLGAKRIVLYSHSSLVAAVNLYRKLGFTEVPLEQGTYSPFRCDMKMELWLDPEIVIKADPSHAPVISAIGRESFHDAFFGVFNKQQDLDRYLNYTYEVGKIAASIEKPNNAFFIAQHNNRPVGFVKVKRQSLNSRISGNKQTELQKLYVLKEYHGKGYAAALMKSVFELTKEIQPSYLWLDVIIQNNKAIRFYEKNGFEKKGYHSYIIGSQNFEYHVMAVKLLAISC